MPESDAARTFNIDQSVIKEIGYRGEEYDEVQGKIRVYYTVKNQLYDSQGNIIGLIGTGLDITAQKEAERLRLENEHQQIILQEKENSALIARTVPHDIRSPLAALNSLLNACGELPEKNLPPT